MIVLNKLLSVKNLNNYKNTLKIPTKKKQK